MPALYQKLQALLTRAKVRDQKGPGTEPVPADRDDDSPPNQKLPTERKQFRLNTFLTRLLNKGKSDNPVSPGTDRAEALPEYRYFRWRGDTYLVGFEWTSTRPRFFARYPLHLEWRQAHIVSKEKLTGDYPVLMQMVAGQLGIATEDDEWRGATRIVLCSDHEPEIEPVYWTAVFHDASPVYDREILTRDPDWLRSLVQDECTNRAIDQLIAPEKFLAIIRADPVLAKPLEQFDNKWQLPDEEPLFLNHRYQPVLLRAAVAVGLFLILLGGGYSYLLIDPDRKILVTLGLAEPPVTPVITYPHVIDWQDFTLACQERQEQSWPAAPGWTMETIGCTARGMQDPQYQPFFAKPAIGSAYRIYQIMPEHHPWLTMQAAAITTRNWDGEIEVSPDGMTLSRPLTVRLQPWENQEYDPTAFADHANRYFLGTADRLEEDDKRIIIRTAVRDRNVFPILHEMQDQVSFGVYAVSRTKGELTLILGQPNVLHLQEVP